MVAVVRMGGDRREMLVPDVSMTDVIVGVVAAVGVGVSVGIDRENHDVFLCFWSFLKARECNEHIGHSFFFLKARESQRGATYAPQNNRY